mgnify:FL=1
MTILTKIFSFSEYTVFSSPLATTELWFSFLVILILMLKEIYFPKIDTSKTPEFYVMFSGLVLICYFFGVFTSNQFIYFQFWGYLNM